ncbi:hypothetical protein Tco_1494422 [Tanacetum coccineum]
MRLNPIRHIDQHPYGVLTTDLHTAYPFMNTPYLLSVQNNSCTDLIDFTDMAPLPPRDQRYLWLRYQDLAERLRMEFMLEFFSTCRIGSEMGLDMANTLCFQLGGARRKSDKGDLSDYWVGISSDRDFLRCAPSYTYIRDPVRRLCHRLISYNISGRGQALEMSPPPPPAAGRTMPQRLRRLEEEMQGLHQDVRSLCGLIERSLADQGRFSTWMISYMTQLMEASGRTYQAFDRTFRGSSPTVFERHTRNTTGEANTSTAPHQPDL